MASAGLIGAILPSCGAMSYPFKAMGDSSAYCGFPNLGFESGATSWTLKGSRAQVQFTSQAKSGSWQVDDVYLDPCIAKLG